MTHCDESHYRAFGNGTRYKKYLYSKKEESCPKKPFNRLKKQASAGYYLGHPDETSKRRLPSLIIRGGS